MRQKLRFGLVLDQVGNIEKINLGRLLATFEGRFFYVFMAKKILYLYCSVCTKKLQKIKLKKMYKHFLKK
jgi:hypothetical protein